MLEPYAGPRDIRFWEIVTPQGRWEIPDHSAGAGGPLLFTERAHAHELLDHLETKGLAPDEWHARPSVATLREEVEQQKQAALERGIARMIYLDPRPPEGRPGIFDAEVIPVESEPDGPS